MTRPLVFEEEILEHQTTIAKSWHLIDILSFVEFDSDFLWKYTIHNTRDAEYWLQILQLNLSLRDDFNDSKNE